MNDTIWSAQANEVLAQHGYPTAKLERIGGGAQSECYGTADVAVLLSRAEVGEQVNDMTGHVLPGDSGSAVSCNSYAVLHWLVDRATAVGVRTPRILAVGQKPRPYALIERAHGTLGSAHPDATDRTAGWFGQLGEELRKAHTVEITGFGMFVPGGAGGYRGRFDTWTDYLDRWLSVHLCVGEARPEGPEGSRRDPGPRHRR